jgi:hypothetical protein
VTVCRVKQPCGLVVSIGSPSERKSAPFVSSVSIGAGSVLAEDFSATELLEVEDLSLGGLRAGFENLNSGISGVSA